MASTEHAIAACTPCPIGSYYELKGGKQKAQCRSCGALQTTLNVGSVDSDECVCEGGTIRDSSTGTCVRCGPGEYADEVAKVCSKCIAGRYVSEPSHILSRCYPCLPGYWCPAGAQNPIRCTGDQLCLGNSTQTSICCDANAVPTGSQSQCICSSGYFALPKEYKNVDIWGQCHALNGPVWPTPQASATL